MKSIKNFENKKVNNMSFAIGGTIRFGSGPGVNGNTRKDKTKNNGHTVTAIGMFDGPRD